MALPKPLITRSDKVMSGADVFAGIRVTVQTLLDYLEEGDTLDEFLKDFPTVSIESLRPLVPEVLRVIEGISTLGTVAGRFRVDRSGRSP